MPTDTLIETKIPLTALVVEDTAHGLFSIMYCLECSEQFDILPVVALNLTRAKNYLQRMKFQVIVLDLGLPDSTSTNTITQIREVASIPIVVVTGGDLTDEEREQFNVKGYLTKRNLSPISLDEEIIHSVETPNFTRFNRKLQLTTASLENTLERLSKDLKI